jgi:hypothetical protein
VPSSEAQPPPSKLPSKLVLNGYQTISSRGTQYRVHAVPTPLAPRQATVVAVPLEVDATLNRLLLVEGS